MNIYHETDDLALLQGDCLEVLRQLGDSVIDTIITDPPYGLSFMGKKWDYDVPAVKLWQEALRVLKPGGTMLCFAGSRTQHRMAVNVEDAGFILKDCIMWLYGSGFPKATDISKQLDKGHKRKQGKLRTDGRGASPQKIENHGQGDTGIGHADGSKQQYHETLPATPEAKLWNGWKSHGLKPAYEPILVAMKPNDGTYANNALVHGVSGLNIDGGRIPTTDNLNGGEFSAKSDKRTATSFEIPQGNGEYVQPPGRFPANVILDEEAGAMLDEQSSTSTTGNRKVKNRIQQEAGSTPFTRGQQAPEYTDKGGASRFFYCAKASKKERNAGCDDMQEKLVGASNGAQSQGEGYDAAATIDLNNVKAMKNHHPTVKPLALMEYLCTLTKTPTGGKVLDPFMGSGTTGLACVNTDRQFIGIERELEYCEIAKARITSG